MFRFSSELISVMRFDSLFHYVDSVCEIRYIKPTLKLDALIH